MGVVPYIGTWIETKKEGEVTSLNIVVPYIGTWIETCIICRKRKANAVVPYIGTWIETISNAKILRVVYGRTLYRYVDWNWHI